MKINSTETGGGADVTHTITICFHGSCPPAGSETFIHLGGAEVKVRSEGSTAHVHKKPVGASNYNPYSIVNWDEHDEECCLTFTCTESEMGNPGGTGKELEFSAECGTDKMPDTGAGTHGW